MSDALILTSLRKAVGLLANAIAQPKDEFVRDAVIQRFEYTYELCWKFIRRQLIQDQGAEAVDSLSRRDLFRIAADQSLITDPGAWFLYHQARNETSHNYNEQKAEETYAVALEFHPSAKELLSTLAARHAGS